MSDASVDELCLPTGPGCSGRPGRPATKGSALALLAVLVGAGPGPGSTTAGPHPAQPDRPDRSSATAPAAPQDGGADLPSGAMCRFVFDGDTLVLVLRP